MGASAIASALLLLAVVVGMAQAYVPISQHSLLPPFDKFKKHSGERIVQNWQVGGHAKSLEHFIRLTEDKQSRRGYIFNTEPLGKQNFGLQLKFRISGSGKHLFGDGLALWLTKQEKRKTFKEGMILGHTDTFNGIGIMFDTFRNVEQGHVHKDISLLVGNGKEPVSLDQDRPGCESQYRYYEERNDFNVDSMSVARVWLEDGTLSLEVDKFGDDNFVKCFSVSLSDYGLADDWQENSHFALSASTGALADNHDILELKVAEPARFKHMLRLDAEDSEAPLVQVELHNELDAEEVGEHVNDLAFEVSDIDKSLKKLQHKVEHDIEKVKLNLERMLQKLEDREDGSQQRINELEKERDNQLNIKIDERLGKLEAEIHMTVEKRLNALERKVGIQIESAAAEGGGGWKLPLIIVVVLVGAYMAYTARSLNKLHRRDKLI
mmetsp:Transcript_15519/g.27572  ORF Transcript_15519/g.27572 Transcript_15519/m.27572 type:complete len:437 (+) Transcript_15519:220-1530(+)